MVSKFHNGIHGPKGQENKIGKDKKTFYRRHTVPITNCSEVNHVYTEPKLSGHLHIFAPVQKVNIALTKA